MRKIAHMKMKSPIKAFDFFLTTRVNELTQFYTTNSPKCGNVLLILGNLHIFLILTNCCFIALFLINGSLCKQT